LNEQSRDRPRGRWRSLRSSALLAICGALLGVLLAEVGVRLLAPQANLVTGGVGGDRWVAHPFLPFAGSPGAETSFSVAPLNVRVFARNNSYGFRAHEFPAEKHAEDFFIVCLGGSTTWGAAAASNAETWPELLESLLAKRYPHRHIQVFNLGTDFATSVYSIVTLGLIGVHLQPDLVIDYEGWNDYGPSMARKYRTDHSHHFVDFNPDAVQGVQRRLPAWMMSARVVALLTFVLDNWMGTNDLGSYVITRHRGDVGDAAIGAGRILENLRTLHSIARGQGAEVIFSTFQFFDGSPPLSKAYREFFDAHGFLYVDQDALIPDHDRTIQFDEGHFTAKGENMMAQNFFDFIVAHQLISE
jgi:lysophospholipase L1-like esterase